MCECKIKLCGMFRECDIDYVNAAMPDYIGFVFAKSRREVTPETAKKLRARLDSRIKAVGVFVNSPAGYCAELVKCGIIDVVQLHGAENADYIRELRALTSAPIIKAVKVTSADDIASAQTLGADYLLLDNGAGGTGKQFDWNVLKGCEIRTPFFLAGGLTPENIAQAIQAAKPFAVDLSSGIETGGVKDREKIISAVNAVKRLKGS